MVERDSVIQVEIKVSAFKKGSWNIRSGDIAGATEMSNVSKKDVIQMIKDDMKELEKQEFK